MAHDAICPSWCSENFVAKRGGKAVALYEDKAVLPDGSILQFRILRVPEPVEGSAHSHKYSLFYGRRGERIVGYDNERLKGDHRHVRGAESPYLFTSPEQLIRDFLADVRAAMADKEDP
jgi:hypothetical protein